MTDARYTRSLDLLADLYSRPILPARQIGLRRASFLMEQLGNPHRAFRSVHVTGSSGKGSTTTMIESILRHGGFTTGILRSPHLVSYTERIGIGGADIGESEWANAFESVWDVVDRMIAGKLSGYDLGRPSFSEVLFAMASVHFKGAGTEWAALEVGMGGRWDPTNLVDSEVAVVTNVSLEHTHVLGRTIRQIAGEKAAIIKAGCRAVTAATAPEALEVIRARCSEVGTPLLLVPGDVCAVAVDDTLAGTRIEISGPGLRAGVELQMIGQFQITNAATAAAAAVSLRQRGLEVPDSAIVGGLAAARLPGRLEIVGRDPLIILDGAHNPDAARALASSLSIYLSNTPTSMVFGALADKDVASMAAALAPHTERVFVTRAPDTPRAYPPAELASHFCHAGTTVTVVEDAGQALRQAIAAASKDGAVVVCGSLYLVGAARSLLTRTPIKA